ASSPRSFRPLNAGGFVAARRNPPLNTYRLESRLHSQTGMSALPERPRSQEDLRPGRLGVPDFDVVEVAVFAPNAELDLGLGGVANAGGFVKRGWSAVERDAHGVADRLDPEGVPF